MGKITEVFAKVQSDLMQKIAIFSKEQQEQCLDLYRKHNTYLLEHADQLQHCYDLLEDKSSKLHYANFLSLSLGRKINNTWAVQAYCNLPKGTVEEVCQNLGKIAHKQGLKLPVILQAADQASYLRYLMSSFGFQQYTYKGWVNIEPNDVFLDCGACLGDTNIWAKQKGAKRVISFEPIEVIYQCFMENMRANDLPLDDCYMLAVGDKNEEQTFNFCVDKIGSAFNVGHDISLPQQALMQNNKSCQDVRVQCVALDDWLTANDITPTFIKMDIEGAEFFALKGAQETIKTLKPKLAICLYHLDQDLYRIIEYLHSIVPEYKFFCRENDYGLEFVLYAATQPLHA